jgi:hypothetical protein
MPRFNRTTRTAAIQARQGDVTTAPGMKKLYNKLGNVMHLNFDSCVVFSSRDWKSFMDFLSSNNPSLFLGLILQFGSH